MSEANEVDGVVMLIPTEGAYQKPKQAKIVKETKTLITVSEIDGVFGKWVFSKRDMLRTGIHKKEFPRWKLTIAT